MEWDEYQAEGICRWVYIVSIAHSNTSNSDIGRVMMKDWQFISRHFCFAVGVATLIAFFDTVIRVFYICNGTNWLRWSVAGYYLTVVGYGLLYGPSMWLGTRCKQCSRSIVFLAGVLLSFGVGVIDTLFNMLGGWFLEVKISGIYLSPQSQITTTLIWIFLPLGAILGGIVALIGRKWSQKIKMP